MFQRASCRDLMALKWSQREGMVQSHSPWAAWGRKCQLGEDSGQRPPALRAEAGRLPATWSGEDNQLGTREKGHRRGPLGNHNVHFMM